MADKAVVDSPNIDSILNEQRKFRAARGIRQARPHQEPRRIRADIQGVSRRSRQILVAASRSELHWFKKWDKVLEWNCPWAKWFVGGQINLSYNCLDRHVTTWRKNKAAIIWESEPGEVRVLTYQQLHREVQKFANVLK